VNILSRKKRTKFEILVLPHTTALYGGAYRLTHNTGDAEDLVQETMLRAYRYWDTFEEGSNCKAWLFKILTNTFLSRCQSQKRSKEILRAAVAQQGSLDGILIQEKAQNQRTPEEIITQQTLSEDVERALQSLPSDFRVAVMLCDVQNFSYKEISEMLNCPVGTVMSRLYRGRRLLKAELQSFAEREGVVRSETSTINLATYRNAKKRG